ncbi:MAG: hypothetical protein OER86_12370 [Phycisphaerae bacterium]|nr:hypothetical protein [Phycisphaerae bacterium]
MQPKMTTWLLLALVGATLGPASPARAEDLRIGGIWYRSVRIIRLSDDRLIYESSAGQREVSLAKIQAIRTDRYPELAKADEAFEKSDWAAAADRYSALLPRVREDYLKILISAKLVASLDASKKASAAIQQYLKLVRLDQGALVAAVSPRNMPADTKERKMLLGTVEAQARATSSPTLKPLLQQLSKRLASKEESFDAASAGSLLRQSGPADVVDQLLAAGKNEKALEILKKKQASKSPGSLPKLYYQRGLALAKLGRDEEAALSFMRVVIHFPKSLQRNPSLIEAGKVLRTMKRPGQARDLWTEARKGPEARGEKKTVAEIDKLLASVK